jgi:hypothetical protein
MQAEFSSRRQLLLTDCLRVFPPEDFGSNVIRTPQSVRHHMLGILQRETSRLSKVYQLDLVVVILASKEETLDLDVSVADAFIMQVLDCGGHLLEVTRGILLAEVLSCYNALHHLTARVEIADHAESGCSGHGDK